MQDNELVELIKTEPDRGLGILMSEYMGLVCTIVREKVDKVCDSFEMEACAGDIFIEFYNGINNYSGDKGSVKSFLCVIAKRRAIDLFRKKSKEFGNVSIDNEEAGLELRSNANVEKEYELKEQKKELLDAVDGLGEPDREIIVRKYYLGESTKQIAERLKMTVTAVDTRTSRALKKLRGVLQGVAIRV